MMTSEAQPKEKPCRGNGCQGCCGKNWPRIYLWLLVGVLGVLGILGAVYTGIQIGKRQTSPSQILTSSPPTTAPTISVPIPTTDPTADWKVYTDPKALFALEYPSDYQATKKGTLDIAPKEANYVTGKTLFRLFVWDNPQELDPKSFFTKMDKEANSQEGGISPFLGHIPVMKKTGSGEEIFFFKDCYCVIACDQAVWSKNKRIYWFVAYKREVPGQEEIFDQILATFKFLE